MCHAAAAAELAQRSGAAFEASCGLLAELCAAASPGSAVADSKSTVLALMWEAELSDLVCHPDSNQLLAACWALHTHLGWSEQEVALALLGLAASQSGHGSPEGSLYCGSVFGWQGANMRRSLLRATAEHIEAVAGLLR